VVNLTQAAKCVQFLCVQKPAHPAGNRFREIPIAL
jgi:hypothetical protein